MTHTAMLMGVAEVLAGMKADLPGTVVFIFQPAEEGPSLFTPASGKSWGAKLMLCRRRVQRSQTRGRLRSARHARPFGANLVS
jgi:hypothetical protein